MKKTNARIFIVLLMLAAAAGLLCACGNNVLEEAVPSAPGSLPPPVPTDASAESPDLSMITYPPAEAMISAGQTLPVFPEQTCPAMPEATPEPLCETQAGPVMAGSGFSEPFIYEYFTDGTARVTGYTGPEEMLPDLPTVLDGYTVTVIGEGTFERIAAEELYGGLSGQGGYEDPEPAGLYIPEGILLIEDLAFAKHGRITVSFSSTVSWIADDAFDGCDILSAYCINNAYAREWCAARGIPAVLIPAAEHPLLNDGLIILPKDTPEGTEMRVDICCPGRWTVRGENAPGTEDWLFIAGDEQGTGDGHIALTVLEVPGDDTCFKGRDTYATVFTVTSEDGGEMSFTVALTKNAAFPNDHINTGDYREDMIAVALTQVGYQSSNVKTDYDGILDSGSRRGDCNKYAKYMGINGNPWCASFVSWCFFQAGVPEEILTSCTEANPGGLSPRVKHGEIPVYYMAALNDTQSSNHKYIKKYGIRVEHEECNPQRGDLIFFRRKGASLSTTFTHLGIVLDHTDGIITYIDGNGGDEDTVKINTIEYNDPYIVAWFTPW